MKKMTFWKNVTKKTRWQKIKIIIGVLLFIVLGIDAYLVWPELIQSVRHLRNVSWSWAFFAVAASLISIWCFARTQKTLLNVGNVDIPQMDALSLAFAANSISITLPGGPLIAATFTYRWMRTNFSTTKILAGWVMIMAGALQAIGLALLGITAAFLVGATKNPFSLLFTLGLVFLLLVLAQYAASRPDALEGVGLTALRYVNHLLKKSPANGIERWRSVVQQIGAVRMNRRQAMYALGWSLGKWMFDAACLIFACYAIGATPSLAGVVVAFAAGNTARTAIPLLPAGLGVMEGVLVPALMAAGMSNGGAITAMVLYRLISFIMIVIIGWVVFFFRFRGQSNTGLDELKEDIEPIDGLDNFWNPSDRNSSGNSSEQATNTGVAENTETKEDTTRTESPDDSPNVSDPENTDT